MFENPQAEALLLQALWGPNIHLIRGGLLFMWPQNRGVVPQLGCLDFTAVHCRRIFLPEAEFENTRHLLWKEDVIVNPCPYLEDLLEQDSRKNFFLQRQVNNLSKTSPMTTTISSGRGVVFPPTKRPILPQKSSTPGIVS